MRYDIKEGVVIYKMEGIKPNYAELARRFQCDYRTVKKHCQQEKSMESNKKAKPSILDPYKQIVEEKADQGCSAYAIFLFLKKKGYQGGYTTVRMYCSQFKKSRQKKATIRIETTPGLSAQVDWKEEMTLYTRQGVAVTFNIFLYILGYSRLKYIQLTHDRKQETLFDCMIHAFEYGEGIPQEIWFDNMKTVVDRSRCQYQKTIFNSKFQAFTKDMGFHPIACRPYRPQTKGKVEALARTMERLRVYNNEFDSLEELEVLINRFLIDLNQEQSQATLSAPIDVWEKEKEHLSPLPNMQIVESYRCETFWRKVSNESMITYQQRKYSVPTQYIGQQIMLKIEDNTLHLYYNQQVIKTHLLSQKKLNYDSQDIREILSSDLMKDCSTEDIERFIAQNMADYDQL